MKLYFPLIILLIVLLLSIVSCDDDPDCDLELPHDEVELVFYNIDDSLLTSYKFEQIGAIGADSIYYTDDDSLSTYSVQVNPSVDTVTFFFITGISRDTLWIRYDRKLEWISGKCGPFMNYDGLEIIQSTFDSASVINSVIDESISENIQIYR